MSITTKAPRPLPPPRLTAAAVVRAALEVTQDAGLARLTLRSVASSLGVQSPSLYHHIPGGLDELQARVVDSVLEHFEEEIDRNEGPGLKGWERLEGSLRAVGRLSREYPGVLQYVLSTGRERRPALQNAEQTVLQLLESELGPVAPAAWLLVHTYVTGWVFAQRPSSAAARAQGFDRLGSVLAEAEQLDQEKVLFDGLRALLAGLLVHRAEPLKADGKILDQTLRRFLR